MAKNQSRTPGRDVRGGSGARNGKAARGAKPAGRGPQRGGGANGRQGGPQKGGAYGAQRGGTGRPGAGRRPGGQRPGGPRQQSAKPLTSYIEGRRASAEALETGVPIKRALVATMDGGLDATLQSLVDRLQAAGVAVEFVPRSRLDVLSSHGAHQGIVLETKPFAYAELSDVIARVGTGDALVVVLDHVTDEGNFGAIVRSAEVVGAAGVVIPKARTASVGTAAYKTSAGAVLHLPIAQVPNLPAALEALKDAGFWVGAASEHAQEDVWHAPMGGRLCLVMGSEGEGISRLVQEKCDFGCRLPQRGMVESLNVAQATTVLCYEWLRRTTEAAAAAAAAAPSAGAGQYTEAGDWA